MKLSEKLKDFLPGDLDYCFFSDSGSVAVEVALKMALQFNINRGSGRKKLLSLTSSYHGDTFMCMKAGDDEDYHFILSEDDKKFLEHYLKYSTIERTGTVHLDLISLALESRSDMVIIPLQDYLGLGNEARINTPSTVGGNWEWRVKEEQLTDELKELIRTLTIKYRTVAEENAKKAAEEAQQ